MKRAARLGVLALAAPLLSGCVGLFELLPIPPLTTTTLNVAYDPSKVSQAPRATLHPLTVRVADLADIRSPNDRIGDRKDKYGLKGAPIRTADPVPQIVRKALTAEFARNGHQEAGEATDVIVSGNISAFWLDSRVGLWAVEVVGTVAVHLIVTNAGTNEVIFNQGYQGIYDEKGTRFSKNDVERVMNTALERLVREISSDSQLIRVLDPL